MTVGQCFNTKTPNKLAPCGTPSFPEGNLMHGNFSPASGTGFTEAGVAQYTSYAKPQTVNDSTLHSVSVVAVVIISERQGENHFRSQLNTDRSV